ncbi:hypothetical protein S83_003462, partial [Arachis hypogaea]
VASTEVQVPRWLKFQHIIFIFGELISVLASGRYSYSIPLCNLLRVGEYGRRKASFFCYYFKFSTVLCPANATKRFAAKLFMK